MSQSRHSDVVDDKVCKDTTHSTLSCLVPTRNEHIYLPPLFGHHLTPVSLIKGLRPKARSPPEPGIVIPCQILTWLRVRLGIWKKILKYSFLIFLDFFIRPPNPSNWILLWGKFNAEDKVFGMRNYGLNVLVLYLRATHFWYSMALRRTVFMSHF